MLLLILFYSFTTVFGSDPLQYNSLLELKCDSYPGRSLFYKTTCYLIIDPDSVRCSEVIPMFAVTRRELSDTKLKQLKFLKKQEATFTNKGKDLLNYREQLCVISKTLYCPPDSELIGTKCFYLNQNKKTHKEAMADCEYKGMKMFYPHSDNDIKTAVEFTQDSNIDEIWLSAVKHALGEWNVNDILSEFDFARWFDTYLLTSSSKKLHTKLSVANGGNTPLGYMSVDESSTLVPPSVCSSIASTEPIVVPTTAMTTTTKATTTTRRTTTTKKPTTTTTRRRTTTTTRRTTTTTRRTTTTTRKTTTTTRKREPQCRQLGGATWFKSAGNGRTRNSFCYAMVHDWRNRHSTKIGPTHGSSYDSYKSYCKKHYDAYPALILSVHDDNAARAAMGHSVNFNYRHPFPRREWSGFVIGLRHFSHRIHSSVQYRWDGTNFGVSHNDYKRWIHGQPNRVTCERGKPSMCTVVLYNKGFMWHQVNCGCGLDNQNWGMICSREAE